MESLSDNEAGHAPWQSSDERALMLRDLEWATDAALGSLGNRELALVHAWYRRQIARGSCRQPVWGRIEKERRDGSTGRRCWRFVVYTDCSVQGRETEHNGYRTRHEARVALARAKAWRWANELTVGGILWEAERISSR